MANIDFTKENVLQKILLVVDGSKSSDVASKFAMNLAKRNCASLLAVFPVDTATMDYLLQMRIFVEEERQDFEDSLILKGKSYLARLHEMAAEYEVPLETQIFRGRFHQEIIKLAKSIDTSLIIVGGWQKNSRHRDNYHTEHELLLEFAECPILVVK